MVVHVVPINLRTTAALFNLVPLTIEIILNGMLIRAAIPNKTFAIAVKNTKKLNPAVVNPLS